MDYVLKNTYSCGIVLSEIKQLLLHSPSRIPVYTVVSFKKESFWVNEFKNDKIEIYI